MKRYDVCIIGGGAAGLAAAASIHKDISVCLLEKNESPGKKLMATGGGRCNITNENCAGKDMTLDFFKSLGLETYHDEEGRYYPYSNRAADVVKLLLTALTEQQVQVVTGTVVSEIRTEDGLFLVTDEKGCTVVAQNVILATGGKAAPQFGSTGDGYAMARSLGHAVTRIYPILTGLECGDLSRIKGVRAKGAVSLYKDGSRIARECGEIQFTEDGISGICVFNLTPYIRAEAGERFPQALDRYHVELDLAPDFTCEDIKGRSGSFGILCETLSEAVPLEQIKCWKLPITGVKGWKHAQCTAGGVELAGIAEETMASKNVPGLYFAGEILDLQGPCGGYNLQNAWETAMKAAGAINRRYGKGRSEGRT